VSDCCTGLVAAISGHFDAGVAKSDLKRYRRKGPNPTTRLLKRAVLDAGGGRSLLDVGSGIGALSFELLASGFETSLAVDASPAYLAAAREEAASRCLGQRFRTLDGDFTQTALRTEPADVVVMDRVVCCYPEYRPLLEAAAQKAGRLFAYSYPRDRWYVKVVMWLDNRIRALRRRPFRTAVHPAGAMDACLVNAGFRRVSRSGTIAWLVDTYQRVAALVLAVAVAATGCAGDRSRTERAARADTAGTSPAPRAGLAINVSGDTVWVGGARFSAPGAARAQIDLVPLRADLSEWAALVWLEGRAVLLWPRGEEAQVLWGGGPPPRTAFLSYSLWLRLLDLDGDGTYELVSDRIAHTDVGPELSDRSVMRLDRAEGRFVEAPRQLAARAPAFGFRMARREPRGLARTLGVGRAMVEVWSEADLVIPVRAGESPDQGLSGISVHAGSEVAQLVYARASSRALAGDAFAVITGVTGRRSALAWRALGPAVLTAAAACPPRIADRSGVAIVPLAGRPGFAVLVTWMSDSLALSGNVLSWDGAALGQPPQPVVLLRCGGETTSPAVLDVAVKADGGLAPLARAPVP
jgi:magnesium-protoporphyrin O-methyltransferase